jgi:hypothetical protein
MDGRGVPAKDEINKLVSESACVIRESRTLCIQITENALSFVNKKEWVTRVEDLHLQSAQDWERRLEEWLSKGELSVLAEGYKGACRAETNWYSRHPVRAARRRRNEDWVAAPWPDAAFLN